MYTKVHGSELQEMICDLLFPHCELTAKMATETLILELQFSFD